MAQLKLVRKGDKFKIFTDGTNELIMIEGVRVSFPAVGHMKEDENDDGTTSRKYKATPMLPKATHAAAKNAFIELKNKLQAANDGVKIASEYLCIKDGDREGQERDEYKDHWVITATETRRPIARNAAGQVYFDPEKIKKGDDAEAIFDQIDEVFYGGVTVNILLRPWYFNGKAKGKSKTLPKRICCGFMGIQFVEATPSFGQGRIDDSEGVWDAVDGAEGGADGLGDDDPDGL